MSGGMSIGLSGQGSWGRTKRRLRDSVIVFCLFALVGPLLRLVLQPSANPGRFDRVVNDVVLYLWPTIVLSIGQETGWRTTSILILENVLLFAVLGFLIGICAARKWAVTTLYFLVCGVIFVVEGWGFKSGLGVLSLCVLAITFLLYSAPFGALRWLLKSDLPRDDGK